MIELPPETLGNNSHLNLTQTSKGEKSEPQQLSDRPTPSSCNNKTAKAMPYFLGLTKMARPLTNMT